MRVETIGNATLYLGDCRDLYKEIAKDCVVITDPPYPDYLTDEYGYQDGIIDFLDQMPCRQFVFWSTRAAFPLSWTARHVWDKRKGGAGSAYEFIYERNGLATQWVFPYVSVQNEVRADFAKDDFTGHKSQKPRQLMEKLISLCDANLIVADFFMGSGSTGVAAVRAGKKFVGVEIRPDYYAMALQRISAAQSQGRLFA